MDDYIKKELEQGLQKLVDRYTGETRSRVALVVSDINVVLANMIADPEDAERHQENLELLYGNLSTIAAIEVKEVRRTVASIVTRVLTKASLALMMAL